MLQISGPSLPWRGGPADIGTFVADAEERVGYADPVVVVDTEGRIHRAAISADEDWPVLLLPNREVRFPGEPREPGYGFEGLAMARGPAGALHAVWVQSGALWYARVDSSTYEGEARELVPESAHWPNLAVRADGEVLIAYEDGFYSRTPDRVLGIVRGTLEDGFVQQTTAPEGCCVDWARGAWSVEVGDVRFSEDGAAHVVFSWRYDATHVDYLTDDGGGAWRRVHRLGLGEVFGGAPGLLLEPEGFSILHVAMPGGLVRRVTAREDGQVEGIVHSADRVSRLLATQDPGGGQHLVLDAERGGKRSIEYFGLGAEAEPVRIRAAGRSERPLALTPRAGGLAWAPDGRLLVPYLDIEPRSAFGRIGLAVGRATE